MLTKTETITITHELYTFEELSQEAQWHAAAETAKYNLTEDMRIMLEEECDRYFPNSEIEAEYDFSGCQGSGLNLYGTFSINDLVHYAYGYYLDDDEADYYTVKIPSNRHYTYSLWSQHAYWGIIQEALHSYFEWHEDEKPTKPTSCKMADEITESIGNLCRTLFGYGNEIVDNYGTVEYNECCLFDVSGNLKGQCWDFLESDGWKEVEVSNA